MTKFETVTELPGEPISLEQLARLVNRYHWAIEYCRGLDVVEVACGAGAGLGLLATVARSVAAGDLSGSILSLARRRYSGRIELLHLDAEELPFGYGTKDVILLFEAIYYLPHPERFVRECARVLRPGGRVLVTTANKDLWEFHPSQHSHCYLGVQELRELFSEGRFECAFFGFQSIERAPLRQKLLRSLKRLAVMTGTIPRTMRGKRWLKRLVFGPEVRMPAELEEDWRAYSPPEPISPSLSDCRHKIIYCAAKRCP